VQNATRAHADAEQALQAARQKAEDAAKAAGNDSQDPTQVNLRQAEQAATPSPATDNTVSRSRHELADAARQRTGRTLTWTSFS